MLNIGLIGNLNKSLFSTNSVNNKVNILHLNDLNIVNFLIINSNNPSNVFNIIKRNKLKFNRNSIIYLNSRYYLPLHYNLLINVFNNDLVKPKFILSNFNYQYLDFDHSSHSGGCSSHGSYGISNSIDNLSTVPNTSDINFIDNPIDGSIDKLNEEQKSFLNLFKLNFISQVYLNNSSLEYLIIQTALLSLSALFKCKPYQLFENLQSNIMLNLLLEEFERFLMEFHYQRNDSLKLKFSSKFKRSSLYSKSKSISSSIDYDSEFIKNNLHYLNGYFLDLSKIISFNHNFQINLTLFNFIQFLKFKNI